MIIGLNHFHSLKGITGIIDVVEGCNPVPAGPNTILLFFRIKSKENPNPINGPAAAQGFGVDVHDLAPSTLPLLSQRGLWEAVLAAHGPSIHVYRYTVNPPVQIIL